ncbi:D-inositol 3-phosphate glycosyltransferase [compost metagenome]|uniref:Glycosyltransferase involved in cell wall biosynthesis n=1 Tax=Agrobacterium tumefaciens TaxID=358 RepID=A0AAW8LVW5_AGRTU|nr:MULTISPECIES: glycosyltransferase family 4 protein [Agrobacterium]KAA1233857.1 glycosyltransferase family 4 protein [Agrobacterium tumefaciens]MBP2510118.1 glycosyltransferase involved in cell wall biosynthesis [Agrobacterium tumefaciens]MBP2519362.1 glycosyltransferase involved in cell wall biosynthesis [Agrobacterium tumefaciens]MBP2540371.1 glycosyltransferase involved in cell wall biosynthesis [Agrobacterium tumefaciens]MBP2565664.1 glycosyltransferase involved in cell wall biosynthesis
MTSALFVSHTGEKGGAELFLADLVKGGPHSWRACFLSGGAAADDLADAGRPPVMLSAGEKMLSIRRNASFGALLRGAADVMAVAWQLSREARHYDVICANSQKALFVCALAAKLSRRPLVWILHDIVTDPAFSATNRRASLAFARLFAKLVAVNSEETGRAFIEAGGEANKVRIVYNGFDPARAKVYEPGKAARLRAELGLGPQPLVGLFGRLSEWKGQHVFLEAIAAMEGVQAVIVGGALFGQEAYEARIREQASSLGLDGRVRFLGFRSDVPELMAAMDAVAHTSIVAEPFGRVVVEAMMCGRPVVATRGGGVTEIIRDGETGLLVPPGEPSALAAALGRVLSDPALAERLAQKGREDVSQRFSLEETCRSVSALLEEAA